MNKLSLLSATKLPEHIRVDYPKLTAFLAAYYRFQETQTSIKDASDIDTVSAGFLKLYKDSMLRGFGDPTEISLRNFIYSNKDFLSKKGTDEAFEFFFRAYFDEEVTVIRPNYLVSSGARANVSFFVYVEKISGSIEEYDIVKIITANDIVRNGTISSSVISKTVTSLNNVFYLTDVGLKIYVNDRLIGTINSFIDSKTVELTADARLDLLNERFHLAGGFSTLVLNTTEVIQLDNDTYAVYFVPHSGFSFSVDDEVVVGNTFLGKVKPAPTKISIIEPGKFWQRGQIITVISRINGEKTLIKVLDVTPSGGIISAVVLHYAYPLTTEQYRVSSYAPIVSTTSDSNTFTRDLFDDGHYENSLEVYDNYSLSDSIVVSVVNTDDVNAYVGDDYPNEYFLQDYVGTLIGYDQFSLTSSGEVENQISQSAFNDLLLQDQQDIIDSYATFQISTGPWSSNYVTYENANGVLSNQNTKLHDNLKYQSYAYSIETKTDISKYRGSINLLHPAGTKFSATLLREFNALNTITLLGVTSLPITYIGLTGLETSTVIG